MPERGEPLSEREMEVLRLVATGATNEQIARELVISVNTVKVHLRNIFVKLGVSSRTEASLYAVREGWITLETPTAVAESPPAEAAAETAPPRPRSPLLRGLPLAGVLTLLLILLLALILSLTVLPPGIIQTSNSPTPSTPISAQRWSVHPPMSQPRSDLALVPFKDALYAIGGDGPEGVTGATERFDLLSNQWTSLASKPTAVADAQGAILGGHIYVPGGRDDQGRPVAVTEVYEIERNRWISASPMPQALSGYAMVAFEGKLYVFGGWDGSAYRDEVLRYSPETDRWEITGQLPFPSAHAGAAVTGNRIFLIGGVDATGPVNVILEYAPALSTWDPQPLDIALGRVQVTALPPWIYVLVNPDAPSIPQLWQHHISKEEWGAIEPPPDGLYPGASIAGIGSEFYVVGGRDGETPLPLIQEYRAIYTTVPIVPVP